MVCWRGFVFVLLLLGVLSLPFNLDVKPSEMSLQQQGSLLQLEKREVGPDEELVGGFGIKEESSNNALAISRPMASLLQEDEGNEENEENETPCPSCSQISVPDDFSGDLNELAELAYEPEDSERVEAKRIHDLSHPPEIPYDDIKSRFLGIRPGEELIGGYGKPDESVENLELEEGFEEPQSDQVRPVTHKSEVLKRDLEHKKDDIQKLTDELNSMKAIKISIEQKVQQLRNEQDSVISQLKAQREADLAQLDADYKKRIDFTKNSATIRATKVKEVESHIAERKLSGQETAAEQERHELQDLLLQKERALTKLKGETATSEERASKLYNSAKMKLFSGSEQLEEPSDLRSTLTKMAEEMEEVDEQEVAEEAHLRDLSTQVEDEERAKKTLELRLKNLRMREEALKEEEKKYEIENANLHHELDAEEVNTEENAERIAHAKRMTEDAPEAAMKNEEAQLTEEERRYEQVAMRAAQDEISRLKAELAKRQRREQHAEEQLLQQESKINEANHDAKEILEEARYIKQKADAEVMMKITNAQKEAEELVKEAQHAIPLIREESKQEELIEGKSEREQELAAQKAREKELRDIEAKAKAEMNEEREKLEDEVRKAEQAEKEAFEKEKDELVKKMKENTDAEAKKYEESKASEINDLDADLVMAKIHSNKNKEELSHLEKQNSELKRKVEELQTQIDQQKREYAFQQLAAQQHIGFAGYDEE